MEGVGVEVRRLREGEGEEVKRLREGREMG